MYEYLAISVVIVRKINGSAAGKKSLNQGAPDNNSPTCNDNSLGTDDLASNDTSYVFPNSKGIFI